VPTIALDHLTEAQAKAFMVADNRLTEVSSWDDRLLAEQLKDLSLADLDFSLEVTGFDMGEIDLLIEGLEGDPLARDRDDELPPTHEVVISRPGDLWVLGPHRVYCGNSLTAASYQQLMGDERASMAFMRHHLLRRWHGSFQDYQNYLRHYRSSHIADCR
jgi:hypothetical protein